MSKPRFTVGIARAFGRKPAKEPFPFQEILPLALKDSVSGKGERTNESACLQEMAVLFACMKTNDFNQSLCTKEIGTFQKCNQNYLDQVKRKKAEGDSGFIGTKTKNVPYQKINKMLRNYPQP